MGTGMEFGPWRTDLSIGLRLELIGLYSWHSLLEYGNHSVTHKAVAMGRIRLESWCNIWAGASVEWNTIISSLSVSIRCTGVGRLVWVQIGNTEGVVPHKTSLTVHVQAGKDGLKGSLSFINQEDSIQSLLAVLLKEQKAEVGWNLLHHWDSIASFIPNRVELQGSGQICDISFSGSARLSINARFIQVNIPGAQGPSTSFTATLQQNLTLHGVQEVLTIFMSTTASEAHFVVENDVCSMLLLANQHRGRKNGRTQCRVFVHHQCVFLKVRQETRKQGHFNSIQFNSVLFI